MNLICWLKGHMVVEWEHLNTEYDAPLYFKGTVVLRQPYCNRCGISKLWKRKYKVNDPLEITNRNL